MKKSLLYNILVLLMVIISPTIILAGKVSDEVQKEQILEQAKEIQVPFIENKGQIKNDDVKFYANTFSGTIFVNKNGFLTYNLPADNDKGVAINEIFTDKKIKVEGLDSSPTQVNYLKGKDENNWKTNLTTYYSVTLGEVYKGIIIDLKVHGSNVEKLFTVLPNENPEQIKIKIFGCQQLKVNENGELEVITDLGAVKFTKPAAFQEIGGKKKSIDVAYVILPENTYCFQIGNYDRTFPLKIDPLLASTFIGGSVNAELGYSIALDTNGNVYVVGHTFSSDYPTTPGAYERIYNNNADVFISKFNSTLSTLLASTFIGGWTSDFVNVSSIAIDTSGNVFIAGWTTESSSDYPTTLGAYDQSYNGGESDFFISKLNSNLNTLLGSTLIGGSGREVSGAIALDASGNVYLTGNTTSSNCPTTSGTYDQSFNGEYDVFVSKFNSSLSNLLSSTYIGGSRLDTVCSIAIDNSGNVYITGSTNYSDYPSTTGAYDRSFNGGQNDVFISKFNSNLSTLLASTFIGGSGDEGSLSIALDASSNIYITGSTSSSGYPSTTGAYDQSFNGGYGDAFISKFNSTLSTLLASTFIGGSSATGFSGEGGTSIDIDTSGNVYITGNTDASSYPTTTGAYDQNFNGRYDIFISKFNSSLSTLLASTFIGGAGDDGESSMSIALDASGNVYITGSAACTDYPTTTGAYDQSFNGYADVFVSKFDSDLSGTVVDVDNDGDGYTENQGDCNDSDVTIHPGAIEICWDSMDNNCNGTIDEGCVITQTWYKDADSDGYSDGASLQSVNRPALTYYLASELTATSDDCNDNDNSIYPGAPEECADGKDNDCDGFTDNGCNSNITSPSNLAAKAKSSTQIVIGWKDNSNNETGFKIEKKAGGCSSLNPWTQIATKQANETTHTVSGLTANTTYSFRVSAYNTSGNSSYSNCVSTKTGVYGTPPSPTNFKATSISSTKVNLTWSDNSTNELHFIIYRKAGSGPWTNLIAPRDAKSLEDTTASMHSSILSYQYYIVANNASGKSPSTNTATVPYQPTNLTAAPGTTAGAIKLTWTDKSTNETGFEIYRKLGSCSSTSTWTKVATLGANKTSWTNRGLSSGSKYSYKIRAYKKTGSVLPAYGYSMYSNCSSATAF